MSRKLLQQILSIFVMLGVLFSAVAPVAAAAPVPASPIAATANLAAHTSGLQKNASAITAACTMLDNSETRALMSPMFESALLRNCGRTEELGGKATLFGAGPQPESFTDARVNNPASDVTASTTQSETSLAVNPNTGTICSTYNDSGMFSSANAFTGWSRSTDGGATFTDMGAVPSAGGQPNYGDPSVVWSIRDNAFYFATLADDGGGGLALALYKSTDDCGSWTYVSAPSSTGNDDKEFLAVDNNPASPYYGYLYISWTDFTDGRITVVTSTNGGTTWSAPVKISQSGASVQGSWPAVAPNGDVYVAWVRWNPYPNGPIDIEVARSTNGGAAFTQVANPMTGEVNPMDNAATATCGRPALKGNIRYLPSPQIAIGPDGALHVVYTYDPDGNGTGDTVNAYYRRSTDNGATWGAEVLLHDDGTNTDQWFPTVSVGESNMVIATWYDRRLDAANNTLFDYYQAISYDGGVSWGANTRVSDVSSGVGTNFDPLIAACYHGDYDQQIQSGVFAYIQWSDDRLIQNGHPDPDVWFEKQPLITSLGYLQGTVTSSAGGAPIAGVAVQAQGVTLTFGTATDMAGMYDMIVAAGTYDLHFSAFGYLPDTVAGVVVPEGVTVTQDIQLDPAPMSEISGYVTDATTGWGLYAQITIAGYPGGAIWTDPETGYYSVMLPNGASYDFDVQAWVEGYLPAAVTVGPVAGSVTQDFALLADAAVCTAPGYSYVGGLFETFDDTAIPAGWTIVSKPDSDCEWAFNNPGGRDNTTGGSGNFAVADSDYCGSGSYMDTELRSPIMDFSGQAEVWLQFKHDYFALGDVADVDVSVDGGATWTNVASYTANDSGPKVIDISAVAGNQASVMVRFHYYDAYWAWWWQVDDVNIGAICTPPADGGLVVGNVYDKNTSQPLDAAVFNESGFFAFTQPTPEDAALDDGFFTVFSPAGSFLHAAMAGDDGYTAQVARVEVPDGGVAAQDFWLEAGWLENTPTALATTLNMGESVTLPFTLTNLGDATATFSIGERNGDFAPAMTTVVKVPASVRGINADPGATMYGHSMFRYPRGHTYYDNNPLLADMTNVLIVHADDGADPLYSILDAYSDIGALDALDVQAYTPSLAELQAYDVVVVWANYAYADAAALGDVLADYVDSGGKVVISTFNWAGTIAGSDIAGRFVDDAYNPFIGYGGGNHFTFADLGAYDGSHPIMQGVTAANDRYRDFVLVDPDAQVVAEWDDGEAFIAVKDSVVAINAYTGLYYAWTGDVGVIFHNAINYLMTTGDVPWFSASPLEGSLSGSGATQLLTPFAGDGLSTERRAALGDAQAPQAPAFRAPRALLQDSSFEFGSPNPYWWEYSAAFGTPLCTVANCGTGAGTAGPRTGDWWAWFGGSGAGDTAALTQTVIIPQDALYLELYGWIGVIGTDPSDVLQLKVDGTPIYQIAPTVVTPGYQRVVVNIGAYADGLPHEITLYAQFAGAGNVSIDDVQIIGTSEQVIEVTFDAGAVTQPGDYTGFVMVGNSTPYGTLSLPVTMTVLAPATYAKLTGSVSGLGYCDAESYLLEGAQVLITGSSGMTWTLQTDENGEYVLWLDESESPLSVEVMYPDHVAATESGVAIAAGQTTTLDVALRWFAPCVSAEPTEFVVNLGLGASASYPLSIFNAGAAPSDFELREMPGTPLQVASTTTPVETVGTPRTLTIGDAAFGRNTRPLTATSVALPKAMPNALTITHSASQTIISANSVSCNAAGIHSDNSYLRTFTLSDFGILGGFEVTEVQVGIETALGAGGSQPVTVNLYTLDGALTWANLTLIGSAAVNLPDQDLTVAAIPVSGIVPANSTLVVEFFTPDGSGSGNSLFVGSNNLGQTAPTYLAAADCGITEPTTTDDIGFPDMQLVMNVTGELTNTDVPWLSAAPVTGTVTADDMAEVMVTFDTMTYTVGTYTATLKVRSDDPMYDTINIPVTLNIGDPTYAMAMAHSADGMAMPGHVMTYTMYLTNTGNLPDTYTVTVGTHTWDSWTDHTTVGPLMPGEMAIFHLMVEVPADALGGEDGMTELTVTSHGEPTMHETVMMTTTAMPLYGVAISDDAAQTGAPGEIVAYTFYITNTGNTTDTFDLSLDGSTWITELEETEITLVSGARGSFTVMVTIPAGAALGDSDLVMVVATSRGDAAISASAHLTTTSTLYKIFLPLIRR